MKVSSISSSSIETVLFSEQQVKPTQYAAQRFYSNVLKMLDHIGTAIAVGETGDLDAIDDFRMKEFGHMKAFGASQ